MTEPFLKKYGGEWHSNLRIKFMDATMYLIKSFILYFIVMSAIIYICITIIGEITKKQIRKTKVNKK